MTGLLARASARFYRRHPAQALLTLVGIAIGVAVVAGMDLANASARRGFELAGSAVAGRTTHRIVGGPAGLAESIYPELRRRWPGLAAAPVVESAVEIGGRSFTLLGIDPLTDGAVRPLARGEAPLDLGALMTRPGAVWLGAAAGARLGIGLGGILPGEGPAGPFAAEVVGLLAATDPSRAAALAGIAVVDLATAQELTGRIGRLDRVDLVLPEGFDPAPLAASLPVGATLVPASDVRAQMTRAFRWNLTALSLLALLCGGFLIYNTLLFSVVQRRPLLGILRTLGVTRGEVMAVVLGEAALLGTVGALLGIAGGLALARSLLALVARTIDDLWFALDVQAVTVDPASLAKAALLGVGASVAAALGPALEAARTAPALALQRSALEAGARRLAPRAALVGAGLVAVAAVTLLLPGRSLAVAFSALFCGLVGAALAVPWAVAVAGRAAARPLTAVLGPVGRLAARGVAGNLSRTAVAVAALAVAVAVTVGVGVMIGSFRQSVAAWLAGSLTADVYLSADVEAVGGPRRPLPPSLVAAVRRTPGVAAVNRIRVAALETPEGPRRLVALDMERAEPEAFPLLAGDPGEAWGRWSAGEGVMVSESLAFRERLRPGDRLSLPTPRGAWQLPVLGVYRDYAGDQGAVLVELGAYRERFGDAAVTGLGVYAAEGTDLGALAERLRREAARHGESLVVRSSGELRASSLEVFDRTFAITGVLRLLAVVVAVVGVLASLLALQLDRRRELAVLRVEGLTPRQVLVASLAETGLLGLFAGLASLPLGLGLAAVMVHVINRRSFGWSMELTVGPDVLVEALALALIAALAAGALPAWRMGRTAPQEALRGE